MGVHGSGASRLRAPSARGGLPKMSPERIGMAVGGERLDGVMGRSEEEEEEEMLVLEDGAFQIAEGGGGRKLGFRRGQSLGSDDLLEKIMWTRVSGIRAS